MRLALRLIPEQTFRATPSAVRPFSSARALKLKEDKRQNPQEIEQAKQEQMKSGKQKEELQSQSETGIQADREKVHDHEEHKEDLQKATAQQVQKEHPEAK